MKRSVPISVQDKILAGALISFFLWLTVPSIANAHKVNIFAYVEGDQVYTESYFPDGRKVEGGTIEIYDSQGKKLLTGTTDKEGKFNFTPPKRDDLNIVLIATMGHKNSYLLSAGELPDAAAMSGSKAGSRAKEPAATDELTLTGNDQSSPGTESIPQSAVSVQTDLREIKKIIDQSLDQRLAPIIRELARSQQEKVSPTEIFGGIGYIFGLIGIILYFTKRKA